MDPPSASPSPNIAPRTAPTLTKSALPPINHYLSPMQASTPSHQTPQTFAPTPPRRQTSSCNLSSVRALPHTSSPHTFARARCLSRPGQCHPPLSSAHLSRHAFSHQRLPQRLQSMASRSLSNLSKSFRRRRQRRRFTTMTSGPLSRKSTGVRTSTLFACSCVSNWHN